MLVLDSGGLTALASDPGLARTTRAWRLGSPFVPTVVLAESLTGDHRRDTAVNRLLAACTVSAVDERVARLAAGARTATQRGGTITAVDAIVAVVAGSAPGGVVLTSDADDFAALRPHTPAGYRIVPV